MTTKQTTTKPAAKPRGKAPETKMVDAPVSTKVVGGVKGDPKGKTDKAVTTPSAVKLSIPITASKSDVEKLIKSIGVRGARLDTDIHSAGCASLNHAGLHNDPTLLNRLVCAMPKAARRNALVTWALKFGNVMLNDGPNKADLPLVYNKGVKAMNIEGAQAEPFWALKNVREGGDEWLYMDYIGNVMKTLQRHAADPKNPEAAKAKAALDALNSINEALNTAPGKAPAPTVPAVIEPVVVH